MPQHRPGRHAASTRTARSGRRTAGFPAASHPTFFTWDGAKLGPAPADPELERRALAHALWPQLAYRALDYRLRDEAAIAELFDEVYATRHPVMAKPFANPLTVMVRSNIPGNEAMLTCSPVKLICS